MPAAKHWHIIYLTANVLRILEPTFLMQSQQPNPLYVLTDTSGTRPAGPAGIRVLCTGSVQSTDELEMPPRRGIVKSGNAGNSPKVSSSKTPQEPKANEEKPLFPPGSKYPLSLLNERYTSSTHIQIWYARIDQSLDVRRTGGRSPS